MKGKFLGQEREVLPGLVPVVILGREPCASVPSMETAELQKVCAVRGSDEKAPRKSGDTKIEVTCKAQKS